MGIMPSPLTFCSLGAAFSAVLREHEFSRFANDHFCLSFAGCFFGGAFGLVSGAGRAGCLCACDGVGLAPGLGAGGLGRGAGVAGLDCGRRRRFGCLRRRFGLRRRTLGRPWSLRRGWFGFCGRGRSLRSRPSLLLLNPIDVSLVGNAYVSDLTEADFTNVTSTTVTIDAGTAPIPGAESNCVPQILVGVRKITAT